MTTIEHNSPLTTSMPGPFTVHLTNLQGGDIQFLTDLIAVFCDPARRDLLAKLRAGNAGIYRDPQTHRAIVSDLFVPPLITKASILKN
jgi:hypothetical protein